jgi:serine/threonine protein kinase/TPR repeat protein
VSDPQPRDGPSGRLIGKKPSPSSEAPTLDVAPATPPAPEAVDADATVSLADRTVQARADDGLWDLLETPPERIGPYQIQREVARGGMGIVFEAYHPQLDRQVAIKVLRAEAEGNARAEHRFLREARAAAKLRHPGIVAVHDVGLDDEGRSYLVMDLVVGESLKDLLTRRGPLPPKEAAALLEQIARAVAHAHDQGILHRDLKPHNVLVDANDGAPLLTDFGLAKNVHRDRDASSAVRRQAVSEAMSQGTSQEDTQALELTQSDDILGTPRYMSPEQIDGRLGEVGVASDIYALGVVLYECLSGQLPYTGETLEELFLKVLKASPAPPSVHAREVPPQLEAIVLRCLEREPRLRYRSALELANDLERFGRAAPVLSVPHRSAPPRRSPWPSLLVACALIGVAVVVAQRQTAGGDASALASETPAPALAEPSPSDEPAELVDDELGPDDPIGLGGPRLAPDVLTTHNVRRYADEGFADAMHLLGYAILSEQMGGATSEGVAWLERAAEAGYARSFVFLGKVHRHGSHGVGVDREVALRWFRKGSEQGSLECALGVGSMLVDDADGHLEAIARLEAVLESEDPRVAELLGLVLFKAGERPRAIDMWTQAAEQGSAPAMRYLAQVHGIGQGVARDYAQALAWFERAAAAGDAKAMVQLGLIHELGTHGQPTDAEQAKSWYRRAVEAGSAEGQLRLDALVAGG